MGWNIITEQFFAEDKMILILFQVLKAEIGMMTALCQQRTSCTKNTGKKGAEC